ncbi:unnamed protein product [Sphagnum troendelagicum]|uniref:Uncharacterized protein n=1 Tax=Sphagnum troendelagicum TaxID=128251 RepID=A0ABP0TIH8_9BRYO
MAAIGLGLSAPLLVINFILYLISAALAGWVLNKNIDYSMSGSGYHIGNAATEWFIPIALVASVVGLASTLAGVHHLRVWRTDSLAAAAATSLIAWLLTLLALGLSSKEIHIGGYRPKRLKTLEAFIIILGFFELLYFLSLHAGTILGEEYGPTYNNTTNVPVPTKGTAAAAV